MTSVHRLCLVLTLLVCASVSAELQTPQQQLACQQQQSSKADPIGVEKLAGCPLTLRGRLLSRGQRQLLLEPTACVAPSDLLARPLAYNHIRNQAFFRFPIRLQHPEFARYVAAKVAKDGQRRDVLAMRPTEVDVSQTYRPKHFTVDNSRLELVDDGSSVVASVGVYCDRESDCRRLQEQIISEPEYFLEILELRITFELVPGCSKTNFVSKKVSLMTQNPEIIFTRMEEPPSTVVPPGLMDLGRPCRERNGSLGNAIPGGLRDTIARLKATVGSSSRVGHLAYFDFRLSCRNLVADAAEYADILGEEDSNRRQDSGVHLTTGGSEIGIRLLDSRLEAASAQPGLLWLYIRYQTDARIGVPHQLMTLISGSDGCSSRDSTGNKSTIAVHLTVTNTDGKVAVRLRGSTVTTTYTKRCSSAGSDTEGEGACSLTVVIPEDRLTGLVSPRIFLDGQPAKLGSEAAMDTAMSAVSRAGGHCWQLRVGGEGFRGVVKCAALAWSPHSPTQADRSLDIARIFDAVCED